MHINNYDARYDKSHTKGTKCYQGEKVKSLLLVVGFRSSFIEET